MNWDTYFMNIVDTVREKSKDINTKIGAVIVGMDNEIRSVGYNGFPRGVNDDIISRYERPIKYMYTEHAERNAIYNAARMGTCLNRCRMYTNAIPCSDCARGIIQSGIVEVIVKDLNVNNRWSESCKVALKMFQESNVIIREMK